MSIRISRYRAVLGRGSRTDIGDTLSFVEDGDFTKQFFQDCELSNDDFDVIEIAITATPSEGDVVPVSENIRDMFYMIDEETTVTIRYAYLEEVSTVLLLAAYFGNRVLPMTPEGSRIAETFIGMQKDYFAKWHTR